MKNKGISFRTKIQAGIVILLMLIVSFSSITADPLRYGTDPDTDITWIGTREKKLFASTATFIVGILDTAGEGGWGSYYAINGTDGSNYTSGPLAAVLNTLCDELYNGTAGGGTDKVYGGTIYIKQGCYNLLDQVRLKPGVTIQGSGGLRQGLQTGTTIGCYLDTAEGAAFYYDDTLYGSGFNAVCIKDIQFSCYNTEPVYAYIELNRALFARIENCVIGMGGPTGYAQYGIILHGSLATWIENCDIRGAIYDGIYMNTSRTPNYEPCNDVVVRDSWIRGNDRDGIYIDEGATAVIVEGCVITANGRYDINCGYDTDAYGGGPQKCLFSGNYFGESAEIVNDYPSIHLRDSKYMTIDSCYFHDSYYINSSYSDKSYLTHNVVSNCYMARMYNTTVNHSVWLNGNDTVIENCAMPGIRVDWGHNYTIRNCVITRDDLGIALNTTYTDNSTLIGNAFRTLTGHDGSTTLLGNPGITTEQLNGLDYIFDNGSQMFEFARSGTVSYIYGGSAAFDDLSLYASSADAYPKIEMTGGGSINNAFATGNDWTVKEDTTARLSVWGATDNVQINGYLDSAHGDLFLLGDGVLALKEGAEPTADAGYGKIYTKSDNKLYFQDGNGTENTIVNSTAVYAQLSSSSDQTFAATGTGYNITFNTNDEINGITHSTSSEPQNITIVTSGVYSIMAQPQVHADAGASGAFHMWLRRDTGSGFADVPNSNVELITVSNGEDVIPLIVIISLDAGDVIRVNASVAHTGIELDAQTPAGEPAIPSIIFSMYKI